MQTALEIYRKDQKSHHEQSIASDLTRGLLRKIFRDTVLESSKQVLCVCIYLPLKHSFGNKASSAQYHPMAQLTNRVGYNTVCTFLCVLEIYVAHSCISVIPSTKIVLVVSRTV